MKQFWIFVFSILTLCPIAGHTAACCGGGVALPSVISGDEKAQATGSYSYSQIKSDVHSSGIWSNRKVTEKSEILKFDSARILSDRWQIGGSFPLVKRSKNGKSSTGLGDISSVIGFEYLTNWTYHPYRPKGIGYFQITLPTGKSIYESESEYFLDSRGRGFWSFGLGTILIKTLKKFDTYGNLEIHRSAKKSIHNKTLNGKLKPGWGGSLNYGLGYNYNKFRFGISNTWSYEDRVEIEGSINTKGAPQRYTTLDLSASYAHNELWSWSIHYSDQTRLGSPTNTSLSRSILILLQKKWPR